MTWYIHLGDDLKRERKMEFPFYRSWNHEPSGDELVFEDWLIESSIAVAPLYPKDGELRPLFSVNAWGAIHDERRTSPS